ncbi:putative O-methyltransferase [Aspergillus sclerotiicarbonarius CBS 121057]|uniref:Putative O-methyltransferase n=1 Tax=Aspergillus sclerotiicarbonarius (strain CBS 121057 / IBT 28362) TaxID=1448318 RepID=A0A319E004_ASPSB|nr:putative O-methyltransferase [Aspergillus sclerotiicarbonarius CBS 121057]
MPTSGIIQLAQLISSQTAVLDTHLQSNNLPQPSFHPDGPTEPIQQSTPVIAKAKTDVIEAAIELRQLLEGPMKLLLPESNFSPLVAVHRFKIASFVPVDSAISFGDLADKCGLLEHDVKCIVRYTAVHHRLFCEPAKGYVAHTAASRLLAEDPIAGHLMVLHYDECWPAHNRTVDAIAQRSDEANMSGYAFANNTSLNTFQFLSHNPSRAQRFAAAMATTSTASLDALSSHFDWNQLPSNSTVVDLGGSQGHVSVHLARKFPHLRFIVQDIAEVVEGATDKLPDDVKGRVEFIAHDMFEEQPVRAEVYLMRYVLHDWQDKYCVEILRNLVPSLKAGSKVVLQEYLLPEPGTMTLLQEMQMRSMDATMLSLFNSRERDVEDWKILFRIADSRFMGFTANRAGGTGSSGVVIVEWSP